MINNLRRGIADSLTEVLMIAIAIAVIAGAVSWITGLWGQESASTTERIFIHQDSRIYLDYNNNNVWLELHISSDIKPSVEIYKVTLYDIEGTASSVLSVEQGGPVTIKPDGTIVIPAGTEAWIKVNFPGLSPTSVHPVYGSNAEIKVYTNTGYMYKSLVTLTTP